MEVNLGDDSIAELIKLIDMYTGGRLSSSMDFNGFFS